MRCIVCDSTDKWQEVDQYRIKPSGMAMCGGCGFVSYPKKWQSEEELKEFYRKDYRPGPNISNWHSGQRKLHYHNAFLQGVFKKWEETKNLTPVIGEIGSAYGLFLNFMREKVPGAQVHGTELTLSYRRNAYHEFGIELSEDFDHSLKYDLIASYKVAEHQWDVDLHLRKCVESLKPDGLMYVSVPTWFNKMTNFGAANFDLEYYYSPNHINVWTRLLFEQVLKKVGLKIIQFNDTMYDETYLCVRDDSVMSQPREYEDPEQIRQALHNIHQAGLAYMEGRFDECVKIWPNFPEAYKALYEHSRQKLHQDPEALKTFLAAAMKNCNGTREILGLIGDLHMRYDRWEDAIKVFEQVLKMCPGYSTAFIGLQQCFREMGNKALIGGDQKAGFAYIAKAREIVRFLREVSDADRTLSINWSFNDNSRLPTPAELR